MKKLGLSLCILLLSTNISVTSLQPTKYFKAVAHPTCGSILITWSNVDGAEGYDIYRKDDGQAIFERFVQLNVDKLYYKDTKNVISGKSIKYYINAMGKDGQIISKTPELVVKPGCYDETECSTRLKFQVGNFMYWVNDKMDGPMNASPEQKNGRVFLVIKYITSTIGAKLEWLASEKKATIKTDKKTIELWIGKNEAKIDGVMVKIDSTNDKVAPYLSNGRTMLPMRFVSDNLGATDLKWDGETKTAIIYIPKKCYEPDCHTLVVESYKDNTLIGLNSAGFKMMFDRTQLGDKKIDIGDMVTVCGTFEIRDDGIYIVSRKQNKIENTSGNWVNGSTVLVDSQKQTISIKLCDGKQQTYNYTEESRVGNLPSMFPVSLFVVNGTVINWKYIEKEKICQADQLNTVDLSVTEINCDKLLISGEVIGSNPVSNFFILMPSPQWCGLKVGSCLRINYFFDGLGNPIGSDYSEIECPCDFEIITTTSKLNATTGSTFKMEFSVKNTGKYEGKFEPFVEAENFPGKFTVSPESDVIPSGKISYFTVEGKINDDFEGIADFNLKTKCRGVTNEKKISLTVSPPVFQVSVASGQNEVQTDENVSLSFDVTNYSDGPITVMAMIEKTDFPGKLTIEPLTKEVPDKNTRSFTITGVWNPKVKPETTYSITYSATCAKVTKSEKTSVTALAPGPIVTLVDGKGDAKGLTLLDGSINWKHYTKSRIEVNWGDGSNEVVKDIPYIHQYKKKGEYKVTVFAHTKEGVSSTANATCTWDGPKPIVYVTGNKWNDPVLTIEGNIDWNSLKPGKIEVDWDDGKKEYKNGFPMSHSFNNLGIFIIKITAIAETGEEGYAFDPIRIVAGLFNVNIIQQPQFMSYH